MLTTRRSVLASSSLLALATVGSSLPAIAETATPTTEGQPSNPVVFYNAQVFTAEYDHPYADAVAIRGDRIIAVGTRGSVERIAGPTARKVDLHGKFLMPGMIDAHVHAIFGGITLIQANFSDTASVAALVEFVAEQMKKRESMRGDVLVINEIKNSYWSHAAEIDAALSEGAFAGQPIVLLGSDGHTAWANRAARTRAGITQEFIRALNPGDRRYYGFDTAFNPNGFVVDTAAYKLQGSLPPFSADFLLRAGQAAVHYLNGFGITGWLDPAVSGYYSGMASVDDPGFLPVYQELASRGELTAHVAAYPVVQPDLGTPQIEVVEALRARFKDVPNLTIPGLKVFADGVAEYPAQTAALSKPYNSGRSAPLLFTPEKMNALLTQAARRGLNAHIHAVGDLRSKPHSMPSKPLARPRPKAPYPSRSRTRGS
jgi:predicted amidohydrolase YtcJ